MDKLKKIKHQVFKYEVPCNVFIELLNDVCDTTNKIYKFDEIGYKRANFNNNVVKTHLEGLRKYYHSSKHYYIDNANTFKGLTTIIRQLCKLYKIKITSNVKYMFSKYSITYSIFIDC